MYIQNNSEATAARPGSFLKEHLKSCIDLGMISFQQAVVREHRKVELARLVRQTVLEEMSSIQLRRGVNNSMHQCNWQTQPEHA